MGFSIVMGDPLYRWIMGWMGWMQCLAQSGAQGKRAKSARKADKKEWSNYIYIHINRLFFLLLGGFKFDSF